jgi:capsular exopolysaccharide synthesis family protein
MVRFRLKHPADGEITNDDLSGRLVTVEDPAGIASEGYRALRTRLFYILADLPPQVIMLTSASPKEGTSTTCANLGVALAQANRSTLLIDCDLRNPVLHKIFGLRNIRGLVDVLVGAYDLQAVLQEPFPNLQVATAGPVPHNPSELLSSERFAELVNQVRQRFDYLLIDSSHVLMDSSSLGALADPVVLATQVDEVLLVLNAQSTDKETLQRAVHTLETGGANILGTIVNNVKVSRRGYS